jgi:hypothetical protein
MITLPVEPSLLVPIGALGLVFGSFVTALSYRLPRGESISHGRSRCPSCAHVLGVPDLVPVLSWVGHGGKCRHCGTKISWRYPLIELVTMALFVAAGVFAPTATHLALLLAMTPLMMALAVIDLEHRRLPNSLVLMLATLALAWRWYGDQAILTGVAGGDRRVVGSGFPKADGAARPWYGRHETICRGGAGVAGPGVSDLRGFGRSSGCALGIDLAMARKSA